MTCRGHATGQKADASPRERAGKSGDSKNI
jgi:hypothetical protein